MKIWDSQASLISYQTIKIGSRDIKTESAECMSEIKTIHQLQCGVSAMSQAVGKTTISAVKCSRV
jgi:hypothetical protein